PARRGPRRVPRAGSRPPAPPAPAPDEAASDDDAVRRSTLGTRLLRFVSPGRHETASSRHGNPPMGRRCATQGDSKTTGLVGPCTVTRRLGTARDALTPVASLRPNHGRTPWPGHGRPADVLATTCVVPW